MAAPVTWRNAGTPWDLRRGCGLPPLPKADAERQAYLEIFRASDEAAEAEALSRHEILRQSIVAAVQRGERRQDACKASRPRDSPSVAAAAAFERLETDSPPVPAKRQRAH